jgi:hypothetical protein
MTVAVPITVYWESAPGVPLVTPVDTPTIRIRRIDTNALEVTDAAMTEIGDGLFKYDFTPAVDSQEYVVRADGDPNATLQVPAFSRYQGGQVDNFAKETWTRLDLDINNPQNYANDGSVISNADFTLTKNDQGNGTFNVDRT